MSGTPEGLTAKRWGPRSSMRCQVLRRPSYSRSLPLACRWASLRSTSSALNTLRIRAMGSPREGEATRLRELMRFSLWGFGGVFIQAQDVPDLNAEKPGKKPAVARNGWGCAKRRTCTGPCAGKDKAARRRLWLGRGRLHAWPLMVCCSSPDSYISIMMSEPPMNSPLTYSCGMVGQLLYSLMPWRISSSSSTLTVFTVLGSTPQALRIWIARPEKPHMGKLALPFMNSTMSLDLTSWSIRVWASLMANTPDRDGSLRPENSTNYRCCGQRAPLQRSMPARSVRLTAG